MEPVIDLERWTRKTGEVQCFGKCIIQPGGLRSALGSPHFVEDDPLRTHSGEEWFWAFAVDDVTALALQYHDCSSELYIGANANLELAKEVAESLLPFEFEPESGLMWS